MKQTESLYSFLLYFLAWCYTSYQIFLAFTAGKIDSGLSRYIDVVTHEDSPGKFAVGLMAAIVINLISLFYVYKSIRENLDKDRRNDKNH